MEWHSLVSVGRIEAMETNMYIDESNNKGHLKSNRSLLPIVD